MSERSEYDNSVHSAGSDVSPTYGNNDFENSSGSEGEDARSMVRSAMFDYGETDYEFESDTEAASPQSPRSADPNAAEAPAPEASSPSDRSPDRGERSPSPSEASGRSSDAEAPDEGVTNSQPPPAGEASKGTVGIAATSGEGYSEDEASNYDAYSDFETEGESASPASPGRSDFREESARAPGLEGFAVDGQEDDEDYEDDAMADDHEEEGGARSASKPQSEEAADEARGEGAAALVATTDPGEEEDLDVRGYVQRLTTRAARQLEAARDGAVAEEVDEVAAMIAAARAAVDRPAGVSTGNMQWEERAVEAAESTAARAAVEFGPVGTPPPGGEEQTGPGYLRDAGVQCGSTLTGSPNSTAIEGQRPNSQFPTFSESFPAPEARQIEVVCQEVQVEVGAGAIRRSSSQLLKSLSGAPLATVDEGQEREPTPTPTKAPRPDGAEEASKSLTGYPSRSTASLKAHHSSQSTHAQSSRPPAPPVQARPLLAHEREALYSGLSQAPSGSLAFGRCLQGRRPTPQGSPVFSPHGSQDDDGEGSHGELAPIPAGHLHRICDPWMKRARPVWLFNRASTPRGRDPVRKVKPLPSGLESRPPEASSVELRTEVASVMAKRRDWLMSDHLGVRYPQTPDAKKRAVAAGAIYYAKPSTSCLQSLGAGGNFPGGRRF